MPSTLAIFFGAWTSAANPMPHIANRNTETFSGRLKHAPERAPGKLYNNVIAFIGSARMLYRRMEFTLIKSAREPRTASGMGAPRDCLRDGCPGNVRSADPCLGPLRWW